MIDVIIPSYNEPKATLRAAKIFLRQGPRKDFRVIVVDPFDETEKFLKENIDDERLIFFKDPGEGKNYALSIIFQEYGSDNKDDFFILSDGDVYVSEGAVGEMTRMFKSNKKLGAITGKVVSVDARNNKFGYWSHLLFDAINKVRARMYKEEIFFQFSGYLMAIRKGIIAECPEGAADDVLIPFLIWKKGYSVGFCEKAHVFIKNPSNWGDWVTQKVRNIKGHENIKNVAPDMPRTKSFFNEIKEGLLFAISYPKNLRELLWSLELYFARLYIYVKAFVDIKQKKVYQDGWRIEEIKSTRMLD